MLNRGEQTLTAVTGSGGRLHFGMVAGIKSERWPTSNRNPRPDCVGIRTATDVTADKAAGGRIGRNGQGIGANCGSYRPRNAEWGFCEPWPGSVLYRLGCLRRLG